MTHGRFFRVGVILAGLATLGACAPGGDRQTIAELEITPGNATISTDGRLFATTHPFRQGAYKLVEVFSGGKYQPFPSAEWSSPETPANQRLVNPLGVRADGRQRLWVIDYGDAQTPPKLLAFHLKDGKLAFRHVFPPHVAGKGSFPQDMAIDEKRQFAYVADAGGAGEPAILVVDLRRNRSWRIEGLPQFLSEDVDMQPDGRSLSLGGKPARIGLNPITLSAKGDLVFFGAMNGTSWYALPADLLRQNTSRKAIAAAIRRVGPKPISDGAATDAAGNHYFTDINRGTVQMLGADGKLTPLAGDQSFDWPDSVAIGADGRVYVAENELHKTAFFNNGVDAGSGRYRIVALTPPDNRNQ